MGAFEGTGDLLKGGRGATIGGIGIAHSDCGSNYYFQKGVLIVPEEALDKLLQALGRLGLGQKDARIEPIEGTGMVQVRIRSRRPIDRLIEELGGTLPVEPSYVLLLSMHIQGLGARRPVPAPPNVVPRNPLRGKGKNVNIGVVDLGFFDPAKAGHPRWATRDVLLDQTMSLPDPNITHLPFVGHGNAIIGILKQLAPASTVCTSTIESQPSDTPGGTTDRRLAEAIQRLLSRNRIHILVVPFGGSTRHGAMPITERVLEPYLGSTLVVASAGNDGLDPTLYPATDPDIVGAGAWKRKAADLGWLGKACSTVASPANAIGSLALADWSNKGLSVQLSAAGEHVPAPFVEASLKIRSGAQDKPAGLRRAKFDGWGLFTGTSFSAAVVAGCIAGKVGGDSPPTPEVLGAAVLR
ncbi:MAG: S8/S53 family peptidase [bacterium]|nr:S8/S53 family peptidase [bacterium]MCP4966820.1 S8/S53 family peptidase [bacterium]